MASFSSSLSEANRDKIWSRIKALADLEGAYWKWREPFFTALLRQGLPKTGKGGPYSGVKLSALLKHLHDMEEESLSEDPSLVGEPFSLIEGERFEAEQIVFSQGQWREKPSWFSRSLDQMARQPAFQQRYTKWAEEERDPMALLNGAIVKEPLFCRIPEGYKGTLRIFLDSSANLSASRLTLWIGAQSELEIECFSMQRGGSLALDFIDLILEKKSRVKMSWERAEKGLNLGFLRGQLMEESKLSFFDLSRGSSLSRLDAQIVLAKEGSSVDLRGLALLDREAQNQTHLRVEHLAVGCLSNQLFKVLLKGRSRSHFQGKIYVAPQAQKTQAYQMNRNLLLSEECQAHSWPNLEILADDVKASHGSTSGSLDEETLFYLLSRGLDPRSAQSLLSHGFALEVLSTWAEEGNPLVQRWKKRVKDL